MCLFVCKSVCVCVCVCVCACVRACVCANMHMYIWMCVCVCARVCVCRYECVFLTPMRPGPSAYMQLGSQSAITLSVPLLMLSGATWRDRGVVSNTMRGLSAEGMFG